MRTTNAIAGTVLVLAATTTAIAAEWEDVKDPAALRALYSDKTFKGKDYLDRPFVGHYRADGQGVLITDGARVPRTWAVNGNDQVCIQLPWDRPCYRFQRHTSKPRVYRSINVKNDMATVITVEDGVPQF